VTRLEKVFFTILRFIGDNIFSKYTAQITVATLQGQLYVISVVIVTNINTMERGKNLILTLASIPCYYYAFCAPSSQTAVNYKQK
jgi:hypothetical protein